MSIQDGYLFFKSFFSPHITCNLLLFSSSLLIMSHDQTKGR